MSIQQIVLVPANFLINTIASGILEKHGCYFGNISGILTRDTLKKSYVKHRVTTRDAGQNP